MNRAIRNQITDAVTEILKNNGVLGPKQALKITLDIVDAPLVIIDKSSDDNVVPLSTLINRIPVKSMRTRARTITSRYNITLEVLKLKSLDEMFEYRNLGRGTLIELQKVLVAEGIRCLWMDELMRSERRC